MLKDTLIKAGDFCFRHRTLQYIPYLIVILANIKQFNNVEESVPFEIACFIITISGILIRILTIAYVPKNTSGRNRQEQVAEVLNTTGMYSIVRNPLYVGNFFIFLGISVLSQSVEIILINSLLMLLFYTLVVLKEEDFLAEKFGSTYIDWTNKVNCFVPSLKHYKKSDRCFSIRKVVKNEHDTWLTTVILFAGIELLDGYFEEHRLFLIPIWIYVLIAVFVIWAVCKFLKKTKRLDPKNEL